MCGVKCTVLYSRKVTSKGTWRKGGRLQWVPSSHYVQTVMSSQSSLPDYQAKVHRGFRLLLLQHSGKQISGCLMGHGKCLTALEDTGFSFHSISKGLTYWYQRNDHLNWFFKYPTLDASYMRFKEKLWRYFYYRFLIPCIR